MEGVCDKRSGLQRGEIERNGVSRGASVCERERQEEIVCVCEREGGRGERERERVCMKKGRRDGVCV